jgi:argininosuccinate lyase
VGRAVQPPTDELMEAFSASVQFDYRLYPFDIAGSMAHARMLGRQGLISADEAKAIVRAWKASGPISRPGASSGTPNWKTCT